LLCLHVGVILSIFRRVGTIHALDLLGHLPTLHLLLHLVGAGRPLLLQPSDFLGACWIGLGQLLTRSLAPFEALALDSVAATWPRTWSTSPLYSRVGRGDADTTTNQERE